MTHYRFVHAADLHLDSPLRGLVREAPHLESTLRDATFRTYESIVQLCIDQGVDALLVAGDIYDGADRSLGAQLRFIEGLKKLQTAGIRVFVCHGNHDPLDGWEARIAFPPNVVRFGPEVFSEPFNLDDPESPLVYGISYPTRDVRENLVPLFPSPESGRYCIGLLHANVGTNSEHEPYAPCSLEDLASSGYDYWALGHVHTRGVLRERNPTIVYPGNPQGRHVNEAGARGVYVVDVDDRGVTTIEFRPLDTVRWERIEVDIEHIEDEQGLLEAVNDRVDDARDAALGRPLVYRLRLHGRGPVHAALARPGVTDDIRKHANDRFGDGAVFAFCERIDDESRPGVDRDVLLQAQDLLGDLLRLIDQTTDGATEEIETLRAELSPLYEHARARRYLDDRMLDTVDIKGLVANAERLLIDQFLDGRGE